MSSTLIECKSIKLNWIQSEIYLEFDNGWVFKIGYFGALVSVCGTHICLNNIWLDWILCFSLDNRFDSIRLERTRLGATDGFLSRPISLWFPNGFWCISIFSAFGFGHIETRLFCLQILMSHCECVCDCGRMYVYRVNEVCWSWNKKTRFKSLFFLKEKHRRSNGKSKDDFDLDSLPSVQIQCMHRHSTHRERKRE